MRLLNRIKKKISTTLYKKTLKPNKDAIWVFGIQKSGTSAIAGLLSERTGLSVTLDTTLLWNPYLKAINDGQLDFGEHIKKNPFDFSKQIIKEPAASLLIKHIKEHFYLEKYLFIYRNPYDVIRSILNRLDIPGDKTNVNMHDVNINWRYIFKDGTDYIEKLANLWLEVYSQESYIFNSRCVLVSYDVFNKSKINFIDELCDNLNLPKKNNINEILNKNFQPRGNANVDLKVFFGTKNFQTIARICDSQMIVFEQHFNNK